MKTYITITPKGMVATEANSKKEAYSKIINAGFSAKKGQVLVSSCNIDYVSCEKIK